MTRRRNRYDGPLVPLERVGHPSAVIWSCDHARAEELMRSPEWKDRHGYIGLPSRKVYTFADAETRDECFDALVAMGLEVVKGDS